MAEQTIATVSSIIGKAFARGADGELRGLQQGDVLREGETLVTPAGSNVELTLVDGTVMPVADVAEMAISRDLVASTASAADESAVQDETVKEVLRALDEGEDISNTLEPTAAQGDRAANDPLLDNDGHSFVRVARIAEDVPEFSALVGAPAAVPEPFEPDADLISVDAEDDRSSTEQGVPVDIDVQRNDSFLEGSNVTAVTQAENGRVVLNSDNTVTYIPNDGFVGTDTFNYTATSVDGNGEDTATVTVEVTGEPVEPPPPPPPPAPEDPPTISIGDDIVVEGDSAEVEVTLSRPSEETVTVRFATSDDTATVSGGDYDAETGTITFAPGQTSVNVSIQTNDDSILEGDEQFLVNLDTPNNATIADGTGVVVIRDGTELPPPPPPPPPVPTDVPRISVSDAEPVSEGNVATFTVTLSEPSTDVISVNYTTLDGTAKVVDGDFQATAGTLVFNPGVTSLQVTVQTDDDLFAEDAENFFLQLSAPSNATIADGQGEGSIVDETDPGPEDTVYANIEVDLASVAEGGQLTYTVSLVDEDNIAVSVPSGKTVSVALDWSGVATPGVDTNALPASVNVSGASSVQFTVDALDDYFDEGSESLIATISGVTDVDGTYEVATIGSSNVASSAITDEPQPGPEDTVYANITVDLPSVAEGGQLTYTVSLVDADNNAVIVPGGSTVTVALDWSGVATPGVDTSALPASVNIGGASSVQFTVDALNDVFTEGSESLIATINSVTDVDGLYEAVAPGSSNVANSAIIDSDEAVYANIVVDAASVAEGGQLTYTVSLVDEDNIAVAVPAGKTVTVALDWSGVATAGVDTSALPASVNITGATDVQFSVDALDDYLAEGSESLIATISGVTDVDSTFEVVAIGASNVANSAIADEPVPGPEDTVYANIVVDLPSVAEGGQLTYTVSLVDDDNNVVNVPAGKTVTVALDWSGVATPGVDTSALPASVDVSGANSVQFTVDALNDVMSEGAESLVTTINGVTDVDGLYEAVAPGSSNVANSAIIDSDEAVYANIVVDAASVAEGGQLTYTVSLVDEDNIAVAVPSGKTVTVALDWSGVATPGVDTSVLPASVNVSGGSSTQFSVDAVDDYLAEGSESLVATISGVTDVDNTFQTLVIGTQNVANSAITDEPQPGPEDTVYANIAVDLASVVEGGQLTYTVSLVDSGNNAVTVPAGNSVNVELDWTGAAASGVDTDALPASVDITSGSSVQFVVTSVDDTEIEVSELLNATITAVNDTDGSFEAVAVGGSPAVSSTILDNDSDRPVELSRLTQVEVDESDLPQGNPGSPGFPVALGSFSFSTPDGFDSFTFGGQGGAVTLTGLAQLLGAIGSGTVGTGTIHNLGEHGTLEFYDATGTPETGMTINFAYTLTSAEHHPISPPANATGIGVDDGFDGFLLQVRDAGSGPLRAAGGVIEVKIIDDVPVLHDPDTVLVDAGSNVPGTPVALNFGDAAGADGIGQIVFDGVVDGAEARNITGNTLHIGDAWKLYTFINDARDTLWLATSDPEAAAPSLIGLTITLDGDSYSVQSNAPLLQAISRGVYDDGPIHVRFGVLGTDGDGDDAPSTPLQADINLSIVPGTAEVVHASGADDTLGGTIADDLFVWELADAGTTATPSQDVVTNFGTDGQDALDVRDLLQLEGEGPGNSVGNLLEYLHVTEDAGNTVLHISSEGGFSGGVFDAGEVNQTITLQGVDLVGGNAVADVIEDMLSSGRLITD
ncbi:MAG: Calx-beta domain-containing protein [Halioglobus sp.]